MRKIGLFILCALMICCASAQATPPATCNVSGVIYDGGANPVPNATVYFNSMNTQVVNGFTIYPIQITSTTDVNGVLSNTALTQGLFIQITICQLQGGGCGAPVAAAVPIAASTTFANLIAGQFVPTTTVLTGNLNASSYRIYNLGANTTTGDALSQGVSTINNLAAATGNYAFGGHKFTGLGAGSGSGDSLAYGLNSLNNLATATGNYSLGGFSLTGIGTLQSNSTNVAFGDNTTLASLTSGLANVGIGVGALSAVATGGGNVAVGADALTNDTAANNTAVGGGALETATSATTNTGFGFDALTLATGSNNTAVGSSAGAVDSTGGSNIFVGVGGNITSGAHNILIGNSLANTTATSNYQLDIGDTIQGGLVGAALPNIRFLAPVNHLTTSVASLPSCSLQLLGAVASVADNDAACAMNAAPAHASCTTGTNCYTCQVQCAEAGSTSYAWIIY